MPRYYEDLEAGDTYALESRYEVDREEITAFAEQIGRASCRERV